jgi:hypothetical protein
MTVAANGMAQPACSACTTADNLRKDLQKQKLTYGNDQDRLKGGETVTATVTQLQDFSKVPSSSSTRPQLFTSLLDLSREAAPFDGEGQIADVLADMIIKDASLRTRFSTYLAGQSKAPGVEFCKSKLLENSVAQDVCLQEGGMKGQGGNASAKLAEKCSKKFDFSECLKTKK